MKNQKQQPPAAPPRPNVAQDQKELYQNIQAANERLGNGRYAPGTPTSKQPNRQDKYAARAPEGHPA